MTDAVKFSGLEPVHLRRRASRKHAACRSSGVEAQGIQLSELDRLYRSLSEVTPENHPRTARLLGSSTRRIAKKLIEEAGETAIEAVKHNTHGIVRESADLLYHLVALWHRADIDPDAVWTEMRCRTDTLGIAEKRPKARIDQRNPTLDRTEQE
jgi:phosphoribosyl-ATP pyrophosphohydrolase